jgi:hypothetical protein
MIFNLNIRQASAATSAEEESNTVLTVMIASLRRKGMTRDHDLEQYESVAHTRLHLHVVEWLRDRNIQYDVGVMRITIDDPDHAMEFKLRWL